MSRPLIIWQLADGKPGHENQSRGLIEALGRRHEVLSHRIDLSGRARIFPRLMHAFEEVRALPRPDLLIGAGHTTHLALLALARRNDARSVVLMKPSIPLIFFDLCVIPRHDLSGAEPPPNVLPTIGALNRVEAGNGMKEGGLILIGGPSSTHGWDTGASLEQVGEILGSASPQRWTLTDSRRTPAGVREALARRFPSLEIHPHEETGPDWLPAQLGKAEEVWVTEDSVSMIYEALSSGARVGLLPVPRKKENGRVARGLETLASEGRVTAFEEWRRSSSLPPAGSPLAEADRCAEWILQQWFP